MNQRTIWILFVVMLTNMFRQISGFCTNSSCRSRNPFSSSTYCCRDGYCCSYTRYRNDFSYTYNRWGAGSIIGTIVGNIFFMLVCVVVCWYCCYRSKRGQRQASSGRVIVTQPVPTIQPGHQGLPPLQMPQPYPTNQPMYPPSAYQETQFMPVPSAAPPSYVAATQGQYAPYPIK